MKAVVVALAILIFNLMMAGVVNTDIFATSPYYESSYADAYNTSLPANISTVSEDEQYTQSLNVIGVLFDTLAWGWIYQFVPIELHTDIAWFVNALTVISSFIIGIAFVELFYKREML